MSLSGTPAQNIGGREPYGGSNQDIGFCSDVDNGIHTRQENFKNHQSVQQKNDNFNDLWADCLNKTYTQTVPNSLPYRRLAPSCHKIRTNYKEMVEKLAGHERKEGLSQPQTSSPAVSSEMCWATPLRYPPAGVVDGAWVADPPPVPMTRDEVKASDNAGVWFGAVCNDPLTYGVRDGEGVFVSNGTGEVPRMIDVDKDALAPGGIEIDNYEKLDLWYPRTNKSNCGPPGMAPDIDSYGHPEGIPAVPYISTDILTFKDGNPASQNADILIYRSHAGKNSRHGPLTVGGVPVFSDCKS